MKGNIKSQWYKSVYEIPFFIEDSYLGIVCRTKERAGLFAIVSVHLVTKWRHLKVRREIDVPLASAAPDIGNAVRGITARYRTLNLRQSEGLMFTGKELSQLLGYKLKYRDVQGIVGDGALIVQQLADLLGAAEPPLRLFASVEPYRQVGGSRANQSNEIFACVGDAQVKQWRRPVNELR